MARLERVLNKLEEINVGAALILSKNNRLYFSGFESSDGAILFTQKEIYFLVDFRYYEAAKNKVKNMKVVLTNSFSETLKKLLADQNIKNILIENNFVTLSHFKSLKAIFHSLGVSILECNALDELISEMRMIKSDDEIKKIKTAQEIAEWAFNNVLKEIKVGIPEKNLAAKLEYFLRKEGASSSAFDLIVLSGKNTSLPHGVPTDKTIEQGDFVTIDMGAVFEGYRSDMTRTIAVGNVGAEQKDVYNVVLKAQLEALSKIKPGVSCSDLDRSARQIIDSTKFKGTFGHSLGHGVGIDIHELPSVSKHSNLTLQEGMVITIEPGVYLENKFGVRTEDMVLVQNNGYKNFVTITKNLIVL